jgi:hypothetical protein
MAGFVGFLKTILIPLLVSAIIYALLTYAILPLIRRHRHRYNQYIPMPTTLSNVSSRTSSIRRHLPSALSNLFLLPVNWPFRRRHVVDGSGGDHVHDEDELFDEEEGEGMVGFDIDDRRREALEQRRSMMGEEDRRLSRELEEGFKDDSDEEGEDERRKSLSRSRGSVAIYAT